MATWVVLRARVGAMCIRLKTLKFALTSLMLITDAKCQQMADNAGLNGKFMAWLSNSTIGMATRYTTATNYPDVGYILLDGTLIASSWSDLTDGAINHAINITEDGQVQGGELVWSSTETNGAAFARGFYSCQDWTVNAVGLDGHVAYNNYVDGGWTDPSTANGCEKLDQRLYCFED